MPYLAVYSRVGIPLPLTLAGITGGECRHLVGFFSISFSKASQSSFRYVLDKFLNISLNVDVYVCSLAL